MCCLDLSPYSSSTLPLSAAMAANHSSSRTLGGPAVSTDSQSPSSISVKGFKVSTQKLPILKANPIEDMTKKLGITPPEMIFGDNFVSIEHEKSGWKISFNAFDALDRVDKTGEKMLEVAYSKEWQRSRFACPSVCYSALTILQGENPRGHQGDC